MGCGPNRMVVVADHIIVSNASGFVPTWMSPWIEIQGNKAILQATVHNTAGTVTSCTFYYEVTYDGKAPRSGFNFTQNATGVNSGGATGQDAYGARLRVDLVGTAATVEFSAVMVFSAQ